MATFVLAFFDTLILKIALSTPSPSGRLSLPRLLMMIVCLDLRNNLKNFATAIFDGIVMRIGLAVLFGLVLDMKHLGFWLGDACAGFTPFVIGVVFLLSGKWKRAGVRIKE